ncbi:MAG: cytochrome c-type biogenesis protein CcmH [bacterium]|nr:cytochrome c-type biogenesis protein CcmH [bacterium]
MKKISLRAVLMLAALLLTPAFQVMAVEPDEILSDPKLEARAREVSVNLRCLVCQNQSIDDSNAELAKDLRVLVRERLTKGDTNEQVVSYIVDRFGEYVLLKPRIGLHTMILWFGPLALLLLAGGYFYMSFRSRPAASVSAASSPKLEALSSEEQAALDKLMNKD